MSQLTSTYVIISCHHFLKNHCNDYTCQITSQIIYRDIKI